MLSEKQRTALEAAIRVLSDGDHNAQMAEELRPLLLRAQADAAPVAWADPADLQEKREQFMACSADHERLNGNLRFKAPLFLHPSLPAAQGLSDVPLGAIENGRTLADRLEAYPFESQGGDLRLCSDWQEFRRCFEHLAQWAMQGAATVAELSKAINPGECAKDVFERGQSLGYFDIPKEAANIGCALASSLTGDRFDWHYFAGRVHVKVLQVAQQQAEPVGDERAAFEAYMFGCHDIARHPEGPYIDSHTAAAWSAWLARAAQSGQRAGVAEDEIDAAAKKLAEAFDYPWDHMPAQGKDDFRAKVRDIAAMLAAAPTQQQEGV